MRQIGLGIVNYESALHRFPAGRRGKESVNHSENQFSCQLEAATHDSGASLFVTILPYAEQQNAYDLIHVDTVPLFVGNVTNWKAVDAAKTDVKQFLQS